MGCKSCKQKAKENAEISDLNVFVSEDGKKISWYHDIINLILRFTLFLVSLISLPFIMAFTVGMLFKVIVLNKSNVDVMPMLVKIGRGLGIGKDKKEYDDEDDEELELYEEENELEK